jgi:iron complex outermembrane receptor protein
LIEAALETAYETFDGRFSGTDEELPRRTQERARLALAIGDDVDVARWKTVVSPQLRWEGVWNFFDGDALFPPVDDDDLPGEHEGSVDPRLGVRVEPVAGVTFKGNIGTYFRPPNFGELFGDDGFSTANAALEPENGVNRDVGVLLRPRVPQPLHDVTLEYAYFNNDVDDMIVFIPSGNRIPRPQNVGSARIRGHEVRLEAAGPGGTSLSANYTHQDAENRTPFPDVVGKQIPSLPRDEGYARLAMDRTRWSIAYEAQARSAVFLDQTNLLERSPSHAVHSVELRLRPWRGGDRSRALDGLEIALEMENLGDEQVSDVYGFPVPGRAFYVTLSYAARFLDDDD